MADISHKRTHKLGLKGAHTAANKMADKLGEKFDLKGTWSGNTLNFARPGVIGILAVSDTEMRLEVTLGFMLKMRRGPIEQSVHEHLDNVLSDAAAKPVTEPVAKIAGKSAKTTGAVGAAKKAVTKKK